MTRSVNNVIKFFKAGSFAMLCTFVNPLFSQGNQYHLTDKYLKQDSANHRNVVVNFEFKNINVLDLYYDAKKLNQIAKAEKNDDYDKLLPLLEDYVSNFGISNFLHNSEMLWKLGQLYEKAGQVDKAKALYRVILKHTDFNIEYVWQYYDKLTAKDNEEYVPIDYYYDLVEFRKQIDTLRPPRGVFLNMGDQVNSDYEDYGPSLNISNDILFFTSKRNREQKFGKELINEDIYWSARKGENEWAAAEPLEGINTPFNEGSPCLSQDGRSIYFIRCEAPDGFGDCDIYTADLNSDGKWDNVRNLGPNVNSAFWDSHPNLTPSGDTLFFVSNRDGGFGSTDIYYTYRSKGGKWQPALNMGPVINTKGTDVSPFYHPKHDVLYFSSNGHLLNFGNFDIYKSNLVNGKWTEPKNIGPLVNGQGEEFYFTIDSDSKDLFYARSENKDFKNLDLYSFPLPMEAQPTATTVFSGTLKDSVTGKPFSGIVSIIDLENGIEVAPKYLRDDGSFSFDLINNNKYLLVLQGEDFFRIEKIFDLKGDTTINFETPSINFVKIEFSSIEFETNKARILDEMKSDLNKIRDFMLDNPAFKLNISGHTDSQGNAKANNQLSQQRADAIKNYLVAKGGIKPERISAMGYGSSRPIIKEEKTEEDRKLNRRVEFEIIRAQMKNGQIDWGKAN